MSAFKDDPDTEDFGSDSGEVEVFHRVNRLKMKAGAAPGDAPIKLDPNAIERAETVIETKAKLYPDEIKTVLDNLQTAWQTIQKTEGEQQEKAIEDLYHTANQAKDLAATFGYSLMQHFGLSLREFTEKIQPDQSEHKIIVQAHINVMNVTLKENIKDDGGKKAAELKAIVQQAIEKYG